MIGIRIGITRRRRGGGGGGDAGTAFLGQSINADGFSGTYASPPTFDPDVDPEAFTVTRTGYTSVGGATTFAENLVVTKRTRQAYPNHASLTTNQVSLSRYVWDDEAVAGGATNNSTQVSPKPVANWARPDRGVVGNTLAKERLEVVADHVHGVAAVLWTISDGTNSVTASVSVPVVSGRTNDRHAVIVWRPASDVDLSSLNDNATLTMNAEVFPHAGIAVSVHDSQDNSDIRSFSPRKFYRSTGLAAAPVYVYVNATTGNNTTGVASTNASLAALSPCLTIQGALLKADATNGNVNGVIIRVMNGGKTTLANTGLVSTLTSALGNEVIITRDPNATVAQAIIDVGLIDWRPRLGTAGGCVRFKEITFDRTAAGDLTGEAASFLLMVFDDCTFDNNTIAASMMEANCAAMWIGTEIQAGVTSFAAAGTRHHLMWRGCLIGGANTMQVECFLMIGCTIPSFGYPTFGSKSPSGSIIAFNRFQDYDQGVDYTAATVNAICSQNLWECTRTTTTYSIQQGGVFAMTHVLMRHNTVVGFNSIGRCNVFYDDNPTVATKFCAMTGNIIVQVNHKGDVFETDGTVSSSSSTQTRSVSSVNSSSAVSSLANTNGSSRPARNLRVSSPRVRTGIIRTCTRTWRGRSEPRPRSACSHRPCAPGTAGAPSPRCA